MLSERRANQPGRGTGCAGSQPHRAGALGAVSKGLSLPQIALPPHSSRTSATSAATPSSTTSSVPASIDSPVRTLSCASNCCETFTNRLLFLVNGGRSCAHVTFEGIHQHQPQHRRGQHIAEQAA